MESKRIYSLRAKLITMILVLVLLMGTFFILIGINSVKNCSKTDIQATLNGVCLQIRQDFVQKYPLESFDIEVFNNNLENELIWFEKYKENFGVEVSIFISNERIITTLKDEHGKRIIGTRQLDERVLNTVFSGNRFSASDVIINNENYYVTYIPLYRQNEVVGMVFAGLSDNNFKKTVMFFYKRILIVVFLISVFSITLTSVFSNKISNSIDEIKDYLKLLTEKQTPDVCLNTKVILRNDEIGDLARYSIQAGGKIKNMIGKDPLTGLYNRRTGRQFLELFWEKSHQENTTFCLAMGDIDLFKSVNDTYGHDVGDEVLMKISNILNNRCKIEEDTFAIRWGGEEFLLGFMFSKDEAKKRLEIIMDEVKQLSFQCGRKEFSVTMTFGLESYTNQCNYETVISQADNKLYIGKEGGRDQIVS